MIPHKSYYEPSIDQLGSWGPQHSTGLWYSQPMQHFPLHFMTLSPRYHIATVHFSVQCSCVPKTGFSFTVIFKWKNSRGVPQDLSFSGALLQNRTLLSEQTILTASVGLERFVTYRQCLLIDSILYLVAKVYCFWSVLCVLVSSWWLAVAGRLYGAAVTLNSLAADIFCSERWALSVRQGKLQEY